MRVKKLGLYQLAQKTYNLVERLSPEMSNCIGVVEDSFDCIIYGASGNGKSNFTAMLVKELVKALDCSCEYVAFEEGAGFTIQETFIGRHNMLEELGNKIVITEHYTYEELIKEMNKQRSAKIWVIDSLQASRLTEGQCAELKRRFVLSNKKKILIYVSWADGKMPKGAAAKSVEYFANIKLRVDRLIVFPKTRYERNGVGNKPFVIYEPGAKQMWGADYKRVLSGKMPRGRKKKEAETHEEFKTETEPTANKLSVLYPETEEEKEARILNNLKNFKPCADS